AILVPRQSVGAQSSSTNAGTGKSGSNDQKQAQAHSDASSRSPLAWTYQGPATTQRTQKARGYKVIPAQMTVAQRGKLWKLPRLRKSGKTNCMFSHFPTSAWKTRRKNRATSFPQFPQLLLLVY